MFSGAADGSVRVTSSETGAKITRISGAHESGIGCLVPVNEGLMAAGDDGGCIKVCSFCSKCSCYYPLSGLIW